MVITLKNVFKNKVDYII